MSDKIKPTEKQGTIPKISSENIMSSIEESHKRAVFHLEEVEKSTGKFTITDVLYVLTLAERELSHQLKK